jgi:benzoyl-CoA reductase/2-hydroxyglutaryl-CoA dehydratase subunit BcrC/BadD/HgdB
VLDTTVNRPAPMSAFDAFFHLALIVTLRGTRTVVDYYTELLDEMKARVADGIAAVPDERYRLLWDNLPVWYRTRWLSDKFAAHGACLVADTYTSSWCGTSNTWTKTIFSAPWPKGIHASTSISAPTRWPTWWSTWSTSTAPTAW